MLDIFGISTAQFETFLLVFMRVTTMLFVFPIFSAMQIPTQLRLGLGVVMSFMLFRLVPAVPAAANLYDLLAAVVSQLVLGMIVGIVASLVFTGISFAGELIDLQIGFAVANILSPQTQTEVTIIGEFELAIATLVFLATNSHYLLLQGIAGSFSLVPLPYITLDPSVMGNIMLFFGQALTIVFKIAAPVAVSLFISNVALAFMARVAPQMNVFVVGLPMQITVGLLLLAISMPLIATVGTEVFNNLPFQMDTVMRGLRPH